jgi:hypothetical protein
VVRYPRGTRRLATIRDRRVADACCRAADSCSSPGRLNTETPFGARGQARETRRFAPRVLCVRYPLMDPHYECTSAVGGCTLLRWPRWQSLLPVCVTSITMLGTGLGSPVRRMDDGRHQRGRRGMIACSAAIGWRLGTGGSRRGRSTRSNQNRTPSRRRLSFVSRSRQRLPRDPDRRSRFRPCDRSS